MSLTPIDKVAEDLFPRDVRGAVNVLIDRDNRVWEVQPSEDNSIQGAKFDISDGRVVLILPRGAISGTSSAFGFQILFRAASGGGFLRGVYHNSSVQPTIDPLDLIVPDGVLSSLKPTPDDTGWKATSDGDFIFCKIVFDNSDPDNPFQVDSCQIKSTGSGDSYKWPVIYLKSGTDPDATYEQIELNFPIAKVSIPSGMSPSVETQYVNRVVALVSAFSQIGKDSAGSNARGISGIYFQ